MERSCRPLLQAWTDQGSLQLPFAESPVSAWPGLRLQAFNLRMAFQTHTPLSTCPRDLRFTEEETEALRVVGPCPGMPSL